LRETGGWGERRGGSNLGGRGEKWNLGDGGGGEGWGVGVGKVVGGEGGKEEGKGEIM